LWSWRPTWIISKIALSHLVRVGWNSGNVCTATPWQLVSKLSRDWLIGRLAAIALVNERVPTRLGDGSVDVEVEGKLTSPFTGDLIDALSVRANWIRVAEPGSPAVVVGVDAAGRALINVGRARFTYGVEGLHRALE
jgi:hypothetical protein